MKKVFYIVLFFTQIFWAQSAFDKGNEFYKQENYEAAAASYESVLKEGKESAEVYFNLGNAYYKLNKVAPAIYNYEKALMLSPNSLEAKINLSFAQKRTIDDIKTVPQVGFSKMFYSVIEKYHYDAWAWIAVGASVIFLLLFVGYYFAVTTLLKRIFFVGMFLGLLIIIISIAASVFVKNQSDKLRPAIVYKETISVKSEPRVNAADAFMLHEGTKVFIVEELDNWRKIRLTDDTQGWITKNVIKELKQDKN